MATKVADLYADLSIRGADFDQKIKSGKDALAGLGKAADESGEQVRRSAVKSASAYQRASSDMEKFGQAARKANQAAADSAEIARIRQQRYTDAVSKHGEESEQALRAQKRLADAEKDAARSADKAETATDKLTVAQRRSANEAQKAAAELKKASAAMDELGGAKGPDFGAMGKKGGDDLGGGLMSGVGDAVAGIGGKAGPIGMALMAVVGTAVGVGTVAGKALANAIQDGMETEKRQDLLQAQLGVNEETAQRIGAAAGAAYVNNFGESVGANMDAARLAIGGGLLSGEEGAPEMQAVIEKLQGVNDLMGGDLQTTTKAASVLMRNGLAANASEAFDIITRGFQTSGDLGGDLIDSISEYGSGWKNTGLTASQSLALINQSVEMGVDNTDRGADALREFGRRVTEEGDTIIGALDGIGLNGREMYDAFKRGGPDAFTAFDKAFDAIRGIEDPVKRNNTAMALLGDTAGDFIGTFTQWDPSAAVRKFGETSGAADNAISVMGDNAASKLESAKRSIEMSSTQIKTALAEAFAPQLDKISNWISTHQPEILGFFQMLGDAAFVTLDAIAAFAEGTLQVMGPMVLGVNAMMSAAARAVGGLSGHLGSVIALLPGMRDTGNSLKETAGKLDAFADVLDRSPEGLERNLTAVQNFRSGLSGMRTDFDNATGAAINSAAGMRSLTESLVGIPDEKTIVINDNSPETIAALEALGLKVEKLPNGLVKVTANTDEGQQVINDFINSPKKTTVTVYAVDENGNSVLNNPLFGKGLGVLRQAAGSIREAQVSNRPILWGEAGPEAYIPLSPARRSRSTSLLGEVAHRFGYGLTHMAEGGVLDSIVAVQHQVAPSLTLTSGVRGEPGSYHNTGNAGDFSNGSGNTDEQLAFATYMAEHYKDQLAELIYQDPRFSGRMIHDGEFVPDAYYANAGDHTNHVHVAAKKALETAATGVDPNSKQGIANRIIAEGKKRGMSDKDIRSALMAGLAESGLQNINYGDRDSLGVFQQRPSQGWGTAEQVTDVDYAIGKYYDTLAGVAGRDKMTDAQMAQAVQRSAYEDASNYQAQAAEADQLLAAYASQQPATASSPGSMPSTGTGIVQVEVTNWPESLTGAKTFAAGGIHDAQIARPGDYRIWNEPAAGGEAYIPFAPGKRSRALGIWAETGRRLGVRGFAAGGFGGYSRDTRDYMAPTGLYDLAALGVGGAFSVASAVAPYVAMANDQKVTLGSLSPTFDTGANDIPGLAAGLSSYLDGIQEQLHAVVEAIRLKQINVDTGAGAAGLMLTKLGQ